MNACGLDSLTTGVMMQSSNRPIHEIRLGHIRASIWANENSRQNVWFNVSIVRSYRDGEEWRTTSSFGRDDLPLVAKAADMAYAWIWNQRGESDAS